MSETVPSGDEDPRRVIKELRQRVKRLQRRVLDPDVLRGQLPLRWPPVRRAAADARTLERERRFLETAPAYADAVAAAGMPLAQCRVTGIDGLTWSVPLVRPDDANLVARALAHQDFPYRVMTQTRDVSIGGIMIDVGANTGRTSVPRVILGDAATVYCAEPDPLNYACLVRNVIDNGLKGLVLPDQLAIGAADGSVRLARGKSAGGHRVIAAATPSRREIVEVPSLTLDSWVERAGIDLDAVRFVKVDVQGSELDVLLGASRVLACKHVAWQIEIDLPLLATRGVQASDLFAALRPHFTHFIDLNRHPAMPRVRPVESLATDLAYVTGGSDGRTDIVLLSLAYLDGNPLTPVAS